jgi:hypothetical protein
VIPTRRGLSFWVTCYGRAVNVLWLPGVEKGRGTYRLMKEPSGIPHRRTSAGELRTGVGRGANLPPCPLKHPKKVPSAALSTPYCIHPSPKSTAHTYISHTNATTSAVYIVHSLSLLHPRCHSLVKRNGIRFHQNQTVELHYPSSAPHPTPRNVTASLDLAHPSSKEEVHHHGTLFSSSHSHASHFLAKLLNSIAREHTIMVDTINVIARYISHYHPRL